LNQTFSVDGDALVLRVNPIPPGTPYEHRCTRDEFERVALAIAGAPAGITLGEIRATTRVEWMEVATAIALLKARSLVEVTPTRLFVLAPGITDLHADALASYHALADAGQPR